MTSPHLSDLAASFDRELRGAQKAARTRTLYGMSIRFFIDWLTEQGRPATLDQLTKHAISAWLGDLGERVAVETVRTRLRGMRRFCRWLVVEGELEKAPTEGVPMPVAPETAPRVLTDEELGRLLKACAVPRGKAGVFDWRVFDGRRDEVIVRLLTDCGLRVSEMTGLTLEDIDMTQELAYVVGKGNRPRAVPFGARTGQAIDRYLRIRSTHPKAKGAKGFLLGQRGVMSVDGVRWRLEELGKAAGVEGLHPHAFRHTNAHRWLAAGNQERDLKYLMGWRSDAMLAVYARSTAVERAQAAHRRAALGDRL